MKINNTFHAPAARKTADEIMAESGKIAELKYMSEILHAVPTIAAVLNKERQFLFSNNTLLAFFGFEQDSSLAGFRPGEVFECVHSAKMEAGCGTSENCRQCGTVNAILESQQTNSKVVKDCRISALSDGEMKSYDFRITATPFSFQNESYTILGVEDVSDEIRRRMIERIFFHDVINTAGGLQGFIGFLREAESEEEIREYIDIANRLSHDLVDEIQAQRALSAAENKELVYTPKEISVLELLHDVVNNLSFHQVAEDKNMVLHPDTLDFNFYSDEVILKRIIINMTKNALEASHEGMTITLGCDKEAGYLSFWVHNSSYMPREVQLQVFQRSFSTKGSDRGLGTYSIKLLTENFLKGKVSFNTSEKEGTRFFARVPE